MTKPGKIVWFDLFSNNIEKSKAFYSELFHWKIEEVKMDPAAPAYTMFKVGDKAIGGICEAPESSLNQFWLAYVAVDNLDTAVATLKKNGGSILFERKLPSVGRWVIAKDPQGAVFAPFEPEKNSMPESQGGNKPTLGQFCWHELMCQDFEKEFTFYSEIFDWKKGEAMDMGPMGTYQIYNSADAGKSDMGVGGMMNITADMPVQKPYWLEYVSVEDVDATVARAIKLGGKATFPAMPIPHGRIAGFVDSQGAACAVVSGDKMD